MFVVVFKTGLLYYSLCSDVDWPAVPRSSDGRARAEPAFPVLCSGSLWAGYCADSGCCEVSLNSTFVFVFGILWFRLLRILAADGCRCVLDGSVCMVLLRWVVFITMVSVVLMLAEFLHVHDNCFHQIGMIASIKLRHPLSFCRANCAKTVVLVCVCLVF